jgi:hypothetical protein
MGYLMVLSVAEISFEWKDCGVSDWKNIVSRVHEVMLEIALHLLGVSK